MAKKPKKKAYQASENELLEKKIGADMVARGNKLVGAGVAGLKERLATDQTQYYSDVAAADDAQNRNTTPNIGTLQGDFTSFANNVRGVFDAKRSARQAGLQENMQLRTAIMDVGNKQNTTALQGLSALSRLDVQAKIDAGSNKQMQYAAMASALGTTGGAIAAKKVYGGGKGD
jgi:hypothetical protein